MSFLKARWFFPNLPGFFSRVRKTSTSNEKRAAVLNGPSLKDFIKSAATENGGSADEDRIPYVSPRDFAAEGRKGK